MTRSQVPHLPSLPTTRSATWGARVMVEGVEDAVAAIAQKVAVRGGVAAVGDVGARARARAAAATG
eukprot:3348981-Prymnesium_polylepis.1